jgi:hypothetical protein
VERESQAAFLIIVGAGMGALSWRAGPTPYAPLPTTFTTSEYIPCPGSLLNRTTTTTSTGTSTNRLPDFGPLLGNLSSITALWYGTGPSKGSSTEATINVLNRSLSAHGETYLLNITTKEVGPFTTIQATSGTTTTITGVNQTSVGSEVVRVSSSGSLIADEGSSGNLTVTPIPLDSLPLVFLYLPSPPSELQVLNRTDVLIGNTNMYVTNYLLPTEVVDLSEQACPGVTFTTGTFTIAHLVIQAGVVPGTDLELVTRYSVSEQLNPPFTSSPTTYQFVDAVVSFTVAG